MTVLQATIIGIALILFLAGSCIYDVFKAPKDRAKFLVKVYTASLIVGIVIYGVLAHFNVSERLFPTWYEDERIRQEYNKANADPFKHLPQDQINGFDGRDYEGSFD